MEPHTRPHGDGTRLSPQERRVLARFRAGDAQAFSELVRPQIPAMLALARRATGDPHWAEDLVQEVLVRALRGLSGFRGEGSLRTWLFRILLRLAGEPQRWRRSERAGPLLDFDPPDRLELPADGLLTRELGERLEEAMERLAPRQRCALHLRAVEGLDYAAISEVLECSPGAARMLVLAARKKVLERMGGYLEP